MKLSLLADDINPFLLMGMRLNSSASTRDLRNLRIVDLANKGLSDWEIARRLGITRTIVTSVTSKATLVPRAAELRAQKQSY
jgi:DNA-binding NarL/FixJ family response regulator